MMMYICSPFFGDLSEWLNESRKHSGESLYKRLIKYWRVVRVVEGARLESVYIRKGIEGSNPSLSA